MSENALTTLDFSSLPTTRKTDLAKYASTNSFLRRIQLCGSDAYVKQAKIAPGHIGVPKSSEEILDLGESADLMLFSVRDKCLDLNLEKPLAVFDPAHEEYQRIFWETYDLAKYEKAGGQLDDNNLPASAVKLVPIRSLDGTMLGYMQGPSFLVFERSSADFYELYLANASGREEAKRMEVFLPISAADAELFDTAPRDPVPCTFKGKYIKGKQHEWWAPQVLKCSEPFDNLPPMEVIVAQINDFVNADIEGQEEEAEEGDRTR